MNVLNKNPVLKDYPVYPVISVIWKLLIMKEIHAPLMPVRYLLTVWQNTSVHMLQQ